jgi:hypothetical protein
MNANSASSPSVSAAPTVIPFALVEAGGELMLAIEARAGRAPVQIVSLDPRIHWVCADGTHEELVWSASGRAGDYARLIRHVQGEGLLVAEIHDLARPSDAPADHWILVATGTSRDGEQAT